MIYVSSHFVRGTCPTTCNASLEELFTMKKPIVLALSLLVLTAAGCGRNMTTAVDEQALSENGVSSNALHVSPDLEQRNFRTHLNGRNEVGPVETRAQGEAIFNLNKEGSALFFKLIVANIEDVTAAHIHMAPKDANGPVVVGLVTMAPDPGRRQGVLAKGMITEADLVGPLAGESFDELIKAMAEGNTYVNVHTLAHPGGEVRGQIH